MNTGSAERFRKKFEKGVKSGKRIIVDGYEVPYNDSDVLIELDDSREVIVITDTTNKPIILPYGTIHLL